MKDEENTGSDLALKPLANKDLDDFILKTFNGIRHNIKHALNHPKGNRQPNDGLPLLSLPIDKFPEKLVAEESFLKLVQAMNELQAERLKVPFKTESVQEAAYFIIRYYFMMLCGNNICATLCFLTLHTREPITVNGRVVEPHLLMSPTTVNDELKPYYNFPALLQACLLYHPDETFDSLFGDLYGLLQLSSSVRFNAIQAAYFIPEVSACSIAYNAILARFKDADFTPQLEAYKDRCNVMFNAIVEHLKHGTTKPPIITEKMCEDISRIRELAESAAKQKLLKNTKPRYRCGNKLAGKYFGVSEATIERWRRWYRNPDDPGATKPPAEFPQGDPSKEEMKYAGEKYRGLHD